MDMTDKEKDLINPASSGSLGAFFETRVQAAFVVFMLTSRISPCLPQWPIQKIKLQGRYAGFNIDDFIVFTKDESTGQEAKLLAQIKRSITITEENDIFKEVIQAAWTDFINPDIFNKEADVFALITVISDTNLRTILDWARHSEDENEFLYKVGKGKFSSEKKQNLLKAFRTQLQNANGGLALSDHQLWDFLKHFYQLGYDLDSDSSSILQLVLSLISKSSNNDPSSIWEMILGEVQSFNPDAGTISLLTISKEIRDSLDTKKNPHFAHDLKKLNERGKYIIEGIRSEIGGFHVKRPELLAQLIENSAENKFVILLGERGCGKSSLIREFTGDLIGKEPVFCLRTEDLDKPHLDNVFSAIGLTSSLGDLEEGLALMPKKYLLIESLEKLLELQNKTAFNDLIQFIQRHPEWTIIASCREYAFQPISFTFLQPSGVNYETIPISGFSDDDITQLCEKFKILKPFAENSLLKPLLKNPFLADLTYQVINNGKEFSNSDGEREFREAIWNDIISKESERSDGMPIRRRRAFIAVAVKRAKQMVYEVTSTEFDANALLKLEADNLIRRNPSNFRVRPDHDVFEDWAIVEYIEEKFQSSTGETKEFLDSIGHEPAMNRAFRLWLNQKLKDGADIKPLILSILNDEKIERIWQDETITAVLQGQNPLGFLCELKDQLFANDSELLKRFCFILRIACKIPNQKLLRQLAIKKELSGFLSHTIFLKPYGPGWDAVIHFIFTEKQNISKNLLPHVSSVLDEWSSQININDDLPPNSREVGLLALHLLSDIKDSHREDEERKKLLNVIVRVVPAIQDEFHKLLEIDLFQEDTKKRRPRYIDDLVDIALRKQESKFLCKYVPDTVINIAWHEWIKVPSDDDIDRGYGYRDADECFGLDKYKTDMKFFPPSGEKGPFSSLLRSPSANGLDFILGFLNTTADSYAHSEFDDPERFPNLPDNMKSSGVQEVEIILNDGSKIKQYCSKRLWVGYRGHEVIPYILQCALMALENWMIDLVTIFDRPEIFEALFSKVLRRSNSVMPTAILASIATGFPDKLGNAALPILRTPEFYGLDLTRMVHERGENEVNWFVPKIDPFADLYIEERRKAALRPWRKKDIEWLVGYLQFTSRRGEILKILDDLRSKTGNDENWRFRFHRIDSRDWKPEVDKKNNRIVFAPQNMEPDLIEIQKETESDQTLNNRFYSLCLWSDKLLKNEKLDREYYATWRDAYKEIESLSTIIQSNTKGDASDIMSSGLFLFSGGLVKGAAVLLRDHHDKITRENFSSGFDLILNSIIVSANSGNPAAIMDETDSSGAAAAASVLPIFLDFASNGEEKIIVRTVITIALTHVNKIVRIEAANGVKNYLWQRDPDFAQKCILGIVEYSRLEALEQKNFKKIDDSNEWIFDFRKKIANREITTDLMNITFDSHIPEHLLTSCSMIPHGSTDPEHIFLISRVLELFGKAEHEESPDSHIRKRNRERIDYKLPTEFGKLLSDHLFNISKVEVKQKYEEQLQLLCDTAPDLVKWVLMWTFVSADKTKKRDCYWELWSKLSGPMQKIAIKNSKNQSRSNRHEDDLVKNQHKLIRDMLFSDLQPYQVEYERENLILGKDLIINFIDAAGVNSIVFESATKLMFQYPDIFFDSGMKILAKHQKAIGGIQLFARNSAFYLEMCINRFLTENSKSISKVLYQSCQILLDALVDTGSSGAYYLREQMVRSRTIAN
jgi:energy-coupling factor transporter ATP-binding protein EcfA2